MSGTGEIDDNGSWRLHRSSTKSVIIEDGIEEIGENAFRNYSDLSYIYIPNTVTEIGDRAFYYCTSLESITIPASVTDMGEFIFYGSTLKTVTFQEGATIICENTFRGSEYLENVVLPNSITTIEDRAFYVCTSLKEITLPNSVTSWGEFIFYGSALETVTFREGLQMIGENAFRGADKLKTVNFPSTLTEIKDRAFYVTEDLEEITLPASLKKMGEFIFYGSGLKKATIAEGATTVYAGVFRACDKLEEVHLPSTITEIQDRAFYACDSLESIVIPASLKKMGDYVFYGSDLDTIYFCGSQSDWNGIKIRNNSEISKAQIIFDYVPEVVQSDSPEKENSLETEITPVPVEVTATPAPTATVEPASPQVPSTDEWDCPNCGKHVSGNFCNYCGTKRPSVEETPAVTEVPATAEPTTKQSSDSETITVKLTSGREVQVRKSVKEALDAYETFMDGYKDAMTKLSNGDFSGYMTFMGEYTELAEKFDNMEDDLTEEESMYYLEVSTRILQKMYE